MSDVFDQALEDAVAEDDREITFDLSDDDDESEAKASKDNGGDIDDDVDDDKPSGTSHIDAANERARKLQEAETLKQQWAEEYVRREANLKDAQAQYAALKKKGFEDGEPDYEAEVAAQDAAIAARYELEKARESYGQAVRYQENVAASQQLAPAAQAWLDANQAYQADSRFKAQADKAMEALRSQGYDPTHLAFYRKLDEQLRKSPRMGQNSRRTPGAPAIHIKQSERERAESQTISKQEAQFLKNIGRDPNDKRVQAQWIDSKNNTRRIAKARGFM